MKLFGALMERVRTAGLGLTVHVAEVTRMLYHDMF